MNNRENLLMSKQESKKQKHQKELTLFREYCKNLDDEEKFKFWIKVLLASYPTIPEIIKSVDKIIEIQASTVSFSSDIFNGGKSIEGQVEKVIDLSERKKSLLNIYIMTKKLLKNLSHNDLDYIEKRFFFKWSTEEIAKHFGISSRTAYRKIERAIDEIFKISQTKNWSLRFIESQTAKEYWLKGRFNKLVHDSFKNATSKNYYMSSDSAVHEDSQELKQA